MAQIINPVKRKRMINQKYFSDLKKVQVREYSED